jgi:hydrogenase-1 operon protein HyaE
MVNEKVQTVGGGAATAARSAFFSGPFARLLSLRDVVEVGVGEYEDFVGGSGNSILFFAGDPDRYPESLDVAAVLPELMKAFPGHFRVGLVRAEAEVALQVKFGFSVWPALVFLREGDYIGVLTGIRDWDEYLREISRLLAAPSSRPPTIGIAVQAPAGGGCSA